MCPFVACWGGWVPRRRARSGKWARVCYWFYHFMHLSTPAYFIIFHVCKTIPHFRTHLTWLMVLTILKNISQWEGLSHIVWKIKNVPNHQPVTIYKTHMCSIHSTQAWQLLFGSLRSEEKKRTKNTDLPCRESSFYWRIFQPTIVY